MRLEILTLEEQTSFSAPLVTQAGRKVKKAAKENALSNCCENKMKFLFGPLILAIFEENKSSPKACCPREQGY